MSGAEAKSVSLIFNKSVSMSQKTRTMSYLRHLPFEKVLSHGEVVGFSFNIEDFNDAVYKGCVQQTRKRCVSVQTQKLERTNKDVSVQTIPPESRSPSPSVFGSEILLLYQL